ncbi:MAG TPA: low specificity L-threonine aldolase [Phycisphaerales bacterium]|nr:low specificity L-threonine aldolase [Phycisphaerales bacterium]
MPPPPADLRSDTVTRPTEAMRRAMAGAEVGDDVLGDDPTVIALEERIANLLGKEAAAFVPSGTMANQAAIRALTEPADEIIAHKDSHIIHYETGAPAAVSGCSIAPAEGERGMFGPDELDRLVRTPNIHAPRSRLLVIENTHNRGGGSVWTLEQVRAVTDRARAHGLRTHLDGARLWNACVATGRPPKDYAACFETVSTCFSKGLGAPVGSSVAGTPETIARVRRFRKMMGGAMRQSGILAAAALHALEHHVDRLAEDHARARRLAEAWASVPGLGVNPAEVQTNIVYVTIEPRLGTAQQWCAAMRELGVWMLPTAPARARAVTHLDITDGMIDRAVSAARTLSGR